MTSLSTLNQQLEAALVMAETRRHGGLLLRIVKGDKWDLRLYNGNNVPNTLKLRVCELRPYIMILLREICSEA